VTVGNFDGVHLGHQALLTATKDRANQMGVPACAYTFDPSPVQILRPDVAPQRLQRVEERIDMLRAMGMDDVVVEPFNRQLAAMTPQVFASEILLARLQPTAMVVGWDFRFCEQRKGAYRDLQELLPCPVEQVDAVEIEGDVISSSRIRRLLATGHVDRIPPLLGRPHQIVGPVIHGHARGRQLGFPTANLALEPLAHPPPGVYAVRVNLPEGPELSGVANLGERPTFGGGGVVLEVHLLDWSGELYGVEMRVNFIARLRAEKPFASPQHLADQIRMDIEHARKWLP